MARTIATIKASITTDFMGNETLASFYGFNVGDSFTEKFSAVSFESILFFIVASAIWALEVLFDYHRKDISDLLEKKKPHNQRWYKQKVLDFQYGRPLLPDSDVYDQIVESEKIVKFAAVTEYQGRVYIKVAGGSETSKDKLTHDQQIALEAYLSEAKDAGVQIGDLLGQTTVTNLDSDHFACEWDIYYDPMVYSDSGIRLDSGADTVRDTIKDFVQNKIPFNGEYRNIALQDELQKLDGIIIPSFKIAKTVKASDYDDAIENETTPQWTTIQVKHLPASGRYKIYQDADLILNFIPYQTVESI